MAIDSEAPRAYRLTVEQYHKMICAVVRIYRQPFDGVYRFEAIANRGDVLTTDALPSLHLPVEDLFPAEPAENS
jgi:hypothetical protein